LPDEPPPAGFLFWKHVFDLPGDQADEAAAMVLKTFKWRKEFGVDKLDEKTLNRGFATITRSL